MQQFFLYNSLPFLFPYNADAQQNLRVVDHDLVTAVSYAIAGELLGKAYLNEQEREQILLQDEIRGKVVMRDYYSTSIHSLTPPFFFR